MITLIVYYGNKNPDRSGSTNGIVILQGQVAAALHPVQNNLAGKLHDRNL